MITEFLTWMAKASFVMLASAVFYHLLLRNRSFFRANRYFLLTTLSLALLAPLLPKPDILPQTYVGGQFSAIQLIFPAEQTSILEFPETAAANTADNKSMDWISLCSAFWAIGFLVSFAKSLVGFNRIRGLIKGAIPFRKHNHVLLSEKIKQPFSIGKYVLLPANIGLCQTDRIEQVLTHEQAHLQQKHHLDLWLLEAIKLLFWWNPLIYWYRNQMREVHEFLADQAVLQEVHPPVYGETLFYFAQSSKLSPVAHGFAQSSLKRRIEMMLKEPFQWKELWLFMPIGLILFGLWYGFIASEGYAIKDTIQSVSIERNTPPESEKEIIVTRKFENLETPTQKASFPGGQGELSKFLQNNLRYPQLAEMAGIQGKVFINLNFKEDGSLNDLKLMKGIGSGCDEEAVRVVKLMPKWIPAQKDGKNIPSNYVLGILFEITDRETFIWPVKEGKLLAKFGMRMHPVLKKRKLHFGIDIQTEIGTAVYASANGEVKFAGTRDDGYGIFLDISHAQNRMTRYSHLSKVLVKAGEKVKQGQLVALTGNTGMSRGPHLHFEIRENNKPVDPFLHLDQNNSPVDQE